MTNDHFKPPTNARQNAPNKLAQAKREETPTMQSKHLTKTPDTFVRERLFRLGCIVATPGALEYMNRNSIAPAELLYLHQTGDWGDLGADDKVENALSVSQGFRIFSCYRRGPMQEAIWVITEADRSVTTLLLPSEY